MKVPARLSLAVVPSPIHPLERLSRPYGVELSLKREDLTGLVTSGNKVRKLEYLLADAQRQGCDTLVTCGGAQSNHGRATAALAVQLGLHCVLVLRGAREAPVQGNLLLDRLLGAEVVPVTTQEYREVERVFARVTDGLRSRGRKPYLIPEGGSNALGAWGYIQCVDELMAQIREGAPAPDSVVCAVGSGGTLAGLHLGAKLHHAPFRIVGINVLDTAGSFRRRVMSIIHEAVAAYDLPVQIRESEIEIIDGYVGEGYGIPTEDQLRLIARAAREEGVLFDPVYTAKALFGLLDQIPRDPGRFGRRILFLHTGGIYSLFTHAEAFRLGA